MVLLSHLYLPYKFEIAGVEVILLTRDLFIEFEVRVLLRRELMARNVLFKSLVSIVYYCLVFHSFQVFEENLGLEHFRALLTGMQPEL